MMFRGTAAELQGLQVAQDAQREEQKAAQNSVMAMPYKDVASSMERLLLKVKQVEKTEHEDGSISFQLPVSDIEARHLTTVTITGGGLGGYGGGSIVPDGYEARHGQPTDAPEAVDIGALTVKFEAQQQRGRSLVSALQALENQWKSDGKPHRFMVE